MRLIDADKLKQVFRSHNGSISLKIIDNIPTVDAVPVVRCKDCVHWRQTVDCGYGDCMHWHCTYLHKVTSPDDYCSNGEKRRKAKMTKTPKCPYCGTEMKKDSGGRVEHLRHWMYCPNCAATSSVAYTLEEAIEQANLCDSTGWVSVKDRLPGTNAEVLIYTSWGSYIIGNYGYHGRKVWSSEEIYAYKDGEITHWMSLPEPPKEK